MTKNLQTVVLTWPIVVMLSLPVCAQAVWVPKDFECGPEAYTGYVEQTTCSPTPKPGVVAFRNEILSAYPDTWDSGIVRSCNIGGQSEHKEGRAWDWGIYVGNPAADEVLSLLLAPDSCGNPHSLIRRLGIMYMIWNYQIWRAYQPEWGWQPYEGDDPHIDHVHFSFSWAGGWAETSYYSASCTPSCLGSVMKYASCSTGDCSIFGATCVMQNDLPTCATEGCTPGCDGDVLKKADCSTTDCASQGAECQLENGTPGCVLNCTPGCDGTKIIGADCTVADCGVFGATCITGADGPSCALACEPGCDGDAIIAADCSVTNCAVEGLTCVEDGGVPQCQPACTPGCQGTVMVAADCTEGDCGVFGANCVMENGVPTCKTSCSPHCDGTTAIDAFCQSTQCAESCAVVAGDAVCTSGCNPHCDGDVLIDTGCATEDCTAAGLSCIYTNNGPICGQAQCELGCSGSVIQYEDCATGDCGVFGLTCGLSNEGPKCVGGGCVPGCDGTIIVDGQCNQADCGVFGAYCSTYGGSPHCVSVFCVDGPNEPPIAKDICIGGERFSCDSSGQLFEKPCIGGTSCNACAGCGPEPIEVCDGLDNDCDGAVDEGVKNACGICGIPPVEVCDGLDNDCDGIVDEGVKNACGGCGPVPNEVCDYIDNDCDGEVDEGLKNACGACGESPSEICDYIDNDCDGETDEGFPGLGDTCGVGEGSCFNLGANTCTEDGVKCNAQPNPPTAEICNGLDDDCDGDIDEGLGVGEPCSVGSGACISSGVWQCTVMGLLTCVVTEAPCDDGDPCTFDICDAGECIYTQNTMCCATDEDCGYAHICVADICRAVQCLPCATDADCGSDAACLGSGSSRYCAANCSSETDCPDFTTCVVVTMLTDSYCIAPEAGDCNCQATQSEVCQDDLLVMVDGCGNVLELIEACSGVCLDGACEVDTAQGDGDTPSNSEEPSQRVETDPISPDSEDSQSADGMDSAIDIRQLDAQSAAEGRTPDIVGRADGGCQVTVQQPSPQNGWLLLLVLARLYVRSSRTRRLG